MTIRIGADHHDVDDTARTYDLAGALAAQTGQRSALVAEEVGLALAELEALLRDQVATIVEQLQLRARDHATTLGATDWQGASKQQALAIDQELTAELDRVLADASQRVEAFCTSLRERTVGYRERVDADIRAAMAAADQRYVALADASRRYLADLQRADATIRLAR